MRRVLLTGSYRGDLLDDPKGLVSLEELLAREVRDGTLDANALLTRYCAMLYRRAGTYEEVARRTGLDRRTVSKYVAEAAHSE